MIIPCREIAMSITKKLKEKVSLLKSEGKTIKLLAVLVGDQPEQHSYVRIKRNLAHSLGIDFEFLHYPMAPPFVEFLAMIQERTTGQDVSGIILQLPLPEHYDHDAIYASLPPAKDIEGHRGNNQYIFPLVQACMIGLDWVYRSQVSSNQDYTLPLTPTRELIHWLQTIQITIAGRGMTTGKPIASYFDKLGIPYIQTNSATEDPDSIYRESDIIICGVGKKIISKENIKKGVILLNFGLHKGAKGQSEKLKQHLVGDYDEDEIKDIASWYTITPGGLGPIDILCLYGNLVESVKAS